MRVMLIKPFSNTPIATLPIGLLYIGTVLKRQGHNVKIIDAHLKKITRKKLLSLIRDFSADIVGLTCMTSEAIYMRTLAKEIKESFPEIKIILGGPHISSFREIEFGYNPYIDYGIIGEGEKGIISLVEHIENQSKPEKIRGIIFRNGDEIISTGEPEFIEDLDLLPIPDFSLISPEDYFAYFGRSFNLVTYTDRVYSLMSSRGCPFGCKYCHKIFGKRIRYFSKERVLEEIKYVIKNYGVKEIDFLDDTINANQQKTIDLFNALLNIKEKDMVFAIPSGVRGDLFSEDLIKTMQGLSFFRINVAYESAVQRVLDIAGKNIKIERVIENTYKLVKVTRLIGGFFMFGFPTETEDDIDKTISLMGTLPLHTASVSFVTPFPNTDFFNVALSRYPIETILKRLTEEDTFYSEPLSLCDISAQRLMEFKKKAMRRFYMNPGRIIMNIRDVPNYISLLRNAINVLRLSVFKKVPY